MPFLSKEGGGCILAVRVVPGARKSSLEGIHNDGLKIKVQAPPVEGAANEAVCEFVAELFGLRASQVKILAGHKGREKRLFVPLAVEQARALLAPHLAN